MNTNEIHELYGRVVATVSIAVGAVDDLYAAEDGKNGRTAYLNRYATALNILEHGLQVGSDLVYQPNPHLAEMANVIADAEGTSSEDRVREAVNEYMDVAVDEDWFEKLNQADYHAQAETV